MSIVILNGPSGTGLSVAASKIQQALEVAGHTVKQVDVEDLLLREICLHFPDITPARDSPMKSTLWELPRDIVSRLLWPRAAQRAAQEIKQSQANLNLVVCHLTYYRGETFEFYEPTNFSDIYEMQFAGEGRERKLAQPIKCVVTIIDDVFDMFPRLTKQGQIFYLQHLISQSLREKLKEDNLPQTPSDAFVVAFEQVVRVLLRLLEWRGREIAAGDSLACNLRVPHFLLAMKHPVSTARDLILWQTESLDNCLPVYLSHPISGPRRRQIREAEGPWPSFVQEFHTFVEALADAEVGGKRALLFMPTTIDELRFAEFDGERRRWLERRWVLPAQELLYELPEGFANYYEYERDCLLEEIFNPKGSKLIQPDPLILGKFADSALDAARNLSPDAQAKVSSLLSSLLYEIESQLAQRDHALVRQSGRSLIYRPFFYKDTLSSGVEGELKNWRKIVERSKELRSANEPVLWPLGRAVFVHGKTEAERRKQEEQSYLYGAISGELGPALTNTLGLEKVDLRSPNWVDNLNYGGAGPLTQGEDPDVLDALKKRLLELWEGHIEGARRMALAGIEIADPDSVRFVVVENLEEATPAVFARIVSEEVLPCLFEEL